MCGWPAGASDDTRPASRDSASSQLFLAWTKGGCIMRQLQSFSVSVHESTGLVLQMEAFSKGAIQPHHTGGEPPPPLLCINPHSSIPTP